MSTLATTEASARDAKLPLAVDLDGTLIRGDLFVEAMLRFVSAKPWRLFTLLAWLMRGRAYAKARLAEAAPFDPADLPYDERFLAWLRAERAQGRVLVLATATNRRAALAVAEHIGIFNAVFASDAQTHLKGERKAQALQEAFPAGFVYAGNEDADERVWRAAHGAVIVNAPAALTRRVAREHGLEAKFARPRSSPRALLTAMRPRQWVKNVLVFLPMVVAHAWGDIGAWRDAVLAFAALSLSASSVYLVNDAADIDADRRHPRKRRRPFASGALHPAIGLGAAAVLAALGVALGLLTGAALFVVGYLVISTLYTFWLKRIHLLDVFVLGGLYMIRVVLGAVATGYAASTWFLAFCCFAFFSLALVKRVGELGVASAHGVRGARSYLPTDVPILKMMGLSAAFVACLVLALYLQDTTVRATYSEPFLLWAVPACLVFWLCRLWLLTDRGEVDDDPLVFTLRDPVSWALGLVATAAYAGAVLLPGHYIRWS
ncbi:MAG: UbiA family prenyltransferase [Hyphomonadaceae bacterium]